MGKPESKIEKKLCEGVRRLGGRAYKLVSPGCAGMPDRLVCLPNGSAIFAELKIETGRLGAQQRHRVDELVGLQQRVCMLYGEKDVEDLLIFLRGWLNA